MGISRRSSAATGLLTAARRFATLDASEKLAIARLLPTVVSVEIGLRLFRTAAVARFLRVPLGDGGRTSGAEDEALPLGQSEERVVRAVGRLFAAWAGDAPCLKRSLVLAARLRSSHAIVRIGTLRSEGGIEAHAWVEIAGHPVGEDPSAAGFQVLRRVSVHR